MILRSAFFWSLVAIVAAAAATRLWFSAHEQPADAVRAFGVMAPLVALTLQVGTAMTPFGSSVMPVVNGMLFPLMLAVVMNLAGGLVANVVLYYVWRRGQREIDIQRRIDAMPAWARRFVRTDLLSLVILRMLPWAGGNLATLLAGAYGVPLRIQVASALLGAAPGAFIYALLGAGLIAL